ncbi:MlaC/ttg2D family ABC transporter substrate-binding protein [Phenylobacterium montanum]|uniref:ABC transporter substrate-binding protein n=1 Tax=Phenylobacterium montanum TaxID=2823693 RepID=A0A975IUD9_9CAUL|nr:ABC transporter substrate-binding protein [Caulobacter sp. S6]QUD86146.1 ABC transporter substrate-binding protein [Caulobacter sp. S6]
MTPGLSFRRFGVASLTLAAALAPLAAASPVLGLTAAAAQSSQRDAAAEQFVQTEASKALNILQLGSDAEKIKQFRTFVDRVADVPKITTFVLGKYARSISPDQYKQFAVVFREYASNVYESRLDDYHGESLKVTGSVVRKPGDVIVTSNVLGGQQKKPVPVRWRVLQSGAGWRVVDVEVNGVWLAITEQQDFVSTIDNAGGNVGVLIAQLQKHNQEAQAGRRS